MEHSYDEYVANANEALEISLVQPGPTGLRTVASFHPKFTYSIFGDEEAIVGYQNLKISLRFDASTMRPNLHVSSSKKLKSVGDAAPTDIPAVLHDYLPPVAFQTPAEFEKAAAASAADELYVPPGERVSSFAGSDGRYEIWRGSLADAAVRQLANRVQVFVPLFIEGGTLIRTDGAAADPLDRWTFFFLYRTRQRPGAADRYEYEFAGYATVYRFLLPVVAPATPPRSDDDDGDDDGDGSRTKNTEKDAEFELPPSDGAFSLATLPCRSRISQFLVLPPFQGRGHGGRLYRAIFDQYLAEPQTREITVEDPNEAFDDVRDQADLAFLSALPAFTAAMRINTAVRIPRTGPAPRDIVDMAAFDALRRQTKIAPRQFHRMVEMYLMQKLAPAVRPSLFRQGEEEEEEEEEEGEGEGEGEDDNKGKGKQTAATPPPPPPPATKEQQHEYKLWRLWVKQRLYRQNKEILGQLERTQRIEKLEETLLSVELEYAALLNVFERRAKALAPQRFLEAVAAAKAAAAPETAQSPASTSSKRKAEESASEVDAKKARVDTA